MLSRIEKKRMSKIATRQRSRLTVKALSLEIARLRERIEDLEDLRDLNDAIAQNADKPGTPWEQARSELGI